MFKLTGKEFEGENIVHTMITFPNWRNFGLGTRDAQVLCPVLLAERAHPLMGMNFFKQLGFTGNGNRRKIINPGKPILGTG